jgi:hypothetical protein
MDKVKLELKTPKNKIIEHDNVSIEIKPIISLAQQVFLIEEYIKDYFGNPEEILIENTRYHYMEAEIKLKNYVIQLNTNIDISQDIVNDILADTILWEKITKEIKNWLPFKGMLETIVYDIKQQETLENSIGKVVSDLIEKGYALLDKLSNLNPDEIKKVGEQGLELMEKLEKSSVLKNPSDLTAIVEGSVPVETEEVPAAKKRTRRKKAT